MTEKPQPVMTGFETLETQLVREAIRVVGDLYVEEILRQAIRYHALDKAKQSEFITDAWSYITKYELSHLLNKDNLTTLWTKVRESKPLSSALLNTAVKLRAMYADGDWNQLMSNLGSGLNILHKGTNSVMDDVATRPLMSAAGPDSILNDNAWVVPLVLLSYMPLTNMPTVLVLHIRTADTAQKTGAVS